MPVSIISRTSKAKNMKKLRKKILVLEIVWNQPFVNRKWTSIGGDPVEADFGNKQK